MTQRSSVNTPAVADPSRRRLLSQLPLLALASSLPSLSSASAASMNPIEQSLEISRSQKKGVTLVVGGANVALLVTEVSDGYVIGRSQQYERIVVRLDRIDAAMA